MVSVEILRDPDALKIPAGLDDLAAFRRWVQSDSFPEKGRIDWIDGEVVIDMSPEDVNTHGTTKSAIAHRLVEIVDEQDLGVVLVDSSRVCIPGANLSCEPDVVVVLFASVETGRVKLVPSATGEPGRFVEIEGPPDLVVECVSNSSVKKDTKRLLESYHRAGVREYWLVDARRPEVSFTIQQPGGAEWIAVPADARGFRRSPLLGVDLRLDRLPPRAGLVRYRLARP